MTINNTGNPVEPNGSADPRDLQDNARNFDLAMNDGSSVWDNRLGVKQPTWAGLINNIFPLGKTYTQEQAEAAIASGEIPNGALFFIWSLQEGKIAIQHKNVDGIATETGDYILSGTSEIGVFNGLSNIFAQQNMFYDDGSFEIWASAGTPGTPSIDPIGGIYSRGGTPLSHVVAYAYGDALHIGSTTNSAYFQYKIDIGKIGVVAGGSATVMLRAVGKAGPSGGQDRILIQQYDSNNAEISSARITEAHPLASMRIPVEYAHAFETAANCAYIQIYVSVSSPASYIEIDRVLIAAGIVDSYRPSALKFRKDIIDSIPKPVETNFIPYLEALGLENSQPNVFNSNAVDVISLNASIVGLGSFGVSELNHTPAWKFTAPVMAASAEAGLSIGTFERNIFGDLMSASFTLLALDANPDVTANVRIMLRQFNAAGDEITSARKIIASLDGSGFTTARRVSISGAEIDNSCVKVDIFMGINNKANAATRSLYFREPLLASGVNDTFRRPPSEAAKVIKEFASSGNVVPNSDFRGIGDVIPSTRWSTAVDIVDKHGERCVKIVGTVPATLVTTELYDVSKFSSGRMSVSVLLMEKIGNQGLTSNQNNLRLRFIGYDAAGTRVNNWGASPGNDGGGYNFYDRNVPLNDITSRTTLVVADNLPIPAGVAFISINFRTEGLNGQPSPSMYLTKFSIREGADISYMPNVASSADSSGGLGEVWISQTGSDNNDGSKNSPFATADKALESIGGVGKIHLAPGVFSGLQFDASKIKDVEIFGTDTLEHNRTSITYGVLVAGITKTAGYNKVYQATVSIAGQPSFIWLDGVADVQTLIPDLERHPLDRGRTYRLPWATKIYRAFEQENRTAALAEIDGDAVPLCYKYTDSGTNVQTLYFSVPAGVNALTAKVYVANNNAYGFFKNLPNLWDVSGKCRIHGIDIKYGGFNLRGFRYSEAYDCLSIGAPINGFDVSWGSVLHLCEAAGAGSGPDTTGDGFNAHNIANWYHYDCYAHDCNDDGWSSHENCVEMGYAPVAVFNGGGGLTPAYGAHAKYYNPLTIRNSVNPRAASTYGAVKFGGVTVVGNPVAGDDGAYTNCEVYDGISRGDKIGYNDDGTRRGLRAYLVAYNSGAYDSVDMGYQCQRAVDCGYSGSAPARDAKTIVENTQSLE